MIAPVDPYIEAFAAAGADILTAHLEAGPHIHRTLQAIREAAASALQPA
jgi:ribulose-phosphate 3-epimerase